MRRCRLLQIAGVWCWAGGTGGYVLYGSCQVDPLSGSKVSILCIDRRPARLRTPDGHIGGRQFEDGICATPTATFHHR